VKSEEQQKNSAEREAMSDEKRVSSNEKGATSNESPQHSSGEWQSQRVSPGGDPSTQPCVCPYSQSSLLSPQSYSDDEIDLLEYWRIIWGKRKLILSVTFAAAVLAAGISLLMPNIYRAEILLAPVSSDDGKGGGLSSALGGLGGLASLAGISLGGGGSVEENLAVLRSREFLWKFIKDQKLMPILYEDDWDAEKKAWKESDPDSQPSLWDVYRTFTKGGLMSVSADKKSGLVTVGIEWKDPELAAEWGNMLVIRLNEFLRQQAINRSQGNLQYLNRELSRTHVADIRLALFELISQEQKKAMLANTQKEFAFQIIDKAVAPDKKAKPKRALIVILSALVAGFLIVIFVFVREGLRKRKDANENN